MARYVLIGSGLAGGLLAAFLGRRGDEVQLFERRSDPRAGNFVGGRSINLALSTRGLHALEQLGLAGAVLEHAIPMHGRMIHDKSGALHFSPYDRDPAKHINSIGRAALNAVVIDAALKFPNVTVRFDHRCDGVDLDLPVAELTNIATGAVIRAQGDTVIGVDGAFSAVRRALQRLDRFDYSQSFLEHGYKEFTIPPGAEGTWRMEKNALHIWPRKSFMMIALPNPDGSFTCTLFWQFDGARSFSTTRTDEEVRRFFDEEFPDAVPLMPDLLQEYREHPTGSLVTVRCGPWHYQDKVVLLGDAAHAVVPFYGQGMNAAFEDCVVLEECLSAAAGDRGQAFSEFYRRRKPNTDALAELALENFIEMRDKTASPVFRAKKKLDHALEGLLPRHYLPLYAMVTFARVPYAEAQARARLQDRLVYGALAALVLLFFLLLLN